MRDVVAVASRMGRRYVRRNCTILFVWFSERSGRADKLECRLIIGISSACS